MSTHHVSVTTVENRPGEPRRRALLVVLFVVYLVLLAWIILWKLEVPYVGAAAGLPRPIKLVPYVASGESGASKPLEAVVNILLFIPFGIYLRVLAPRWRWWQAAAVFVGASLLFETVQYLLSVGSADITDVIDNTLGGMLGLGLFSLARRRLRERTDDLVTRILLITGIVAVLAVAVFLVSGLHYADQHDVVVPHPTLSRTP